MYWPSQLVAAPVSNWADDSPSRATVGGDRFAHQSAAMHTGSHHQLDVAFADVLARQNLLGVLASWRAQQYPYRGRGPYASCTRAACGGTVGDSGGHVCSWQRAAVWEAHVWLTGSGSHIAMRTSAFSGAIAQQTLGVVVAACAEAHISGIFLRACGWSGGTHCGEGTDLCPRIFHKCSIRVLCCHRCGLAPATPALPCPPPSIFCWRSHGAEAKAVALLLVRG